MNAGTGQTMSLWTIVATLEYAHTEISEQTGRAKIAV